MSSVLREARQGEARRGERRTHCTSRISTARSDATTARPLSSHCLLPVVCYIHLNILRLFSSTSFSPRSIRQICFIFLLFCLLQFFFFLFLFLFKALSLILRRRRRCQFLGLIYQSKVKMELLQLWQWQWRKEVLLLLLFDDGSWLH